MAKTTMNVSISDSLKDKAQLQVQKNDFSTMSDYIQHLIRTDVERQKAREQFDAYIQAGVDSGISPLSGAEIFAELRQKIADVAKTKSRK